MRPASETHLALLQAAHAIHTERAETGQGATLLELVHRSQVGYKVARALVAKLKCRGQLQIVGQRRVAYRNRPVAEYAPAVPVPDLVPVAVDGGLIELCDCLAAWHTAT